MHLTGVRWGAVVGIAVLIEILLIAAAIGYMFVYGTFLNPGHPEDFYQAHVRVAAPWISIAVGLPIFFVSARWLARRSRGPAAMTNAVALWFVWALIDTSILLASDGLEGIRRIFPFWLASYLTKFVGAWMGERTGHRKPVQTLR
jgi:hypothetical protein